MKKFLIFLVAIVVVVCFGATTYYFLRNDEVIKLSKSSLQINLNETFSLRAKDFKGLGLTVTRKNRNTKYGYKVYKVDENGQKQDVTDKDYIIYDKANDVYMVQEGGQFIFAITTTNKKYKELSVNLTVGNGSLDAPYFIRTADELSRYLGESNSGDNNASLLNDITLPSGFESLPTFDDTFYGNGYAINGLNISGEQNNGGLFTEIKGNVYDLTLNNPIVNGSYKNVGALAGTINSKAVISGVQIKHPTITNTNSDGATGGLAGTISGNALIAVSYTEQANLNVDNGAAAAAIAVSGKAVGGLVGVNDKASIKASYAKDVTISGSTNANAGGLVGEFIVSKNYDTDNNTSAKFNNRGTIQQSYATGATGEETGAFIGKVTSDGDNITKENSEPLSYLVGNYAENESNELVKDTSAATSLFTELQQPAVSVTPNYINSLPEDNEYMFYGETPWQANLWNFNGETPSLKLANGISADSTQSPEVSYYYSIREASTASDAQSLKQALQSTDKNNQNVEVEYTADGYTLDEKFDFTNRSLTGVADEQGNLPVIKVNKGLFKTVSGSSISNIVLEVSGIEATGDTFGAIANLVEGGSTITNVTVKFTNEVVVPDTVTTFGGVAGHLTNSTISNCSVIGLNIKSSKITNFGGIAALTTDSTIQINNNTVEATVNTSEKARIGGIAATNTKEIVGNDINLAVKLNVVSVGAESSIAAIAAYNSGTISNIKLNGEVDFPSNCTGTLSVAGVAVDNEGAISKVYFETGRLGNTSNGEVGYNHVVAGLVVNAKANSSISQATVKADLNGYNVSGIVSYMAQTSARIDQVYVGGNTLFATGYVSNISYDASLGSITNVQLASTLKGRAAETHVSALVYVFNQGGNIKYVTVNSVFEGSGIFHRETRYMHTGTKSDQYDLNNILAGSNQAGEMSNVIINTDKLVSGSVKDYYHCYYIGNGAWAGFFYPQLTTPWISFVRPLSNDEFNNSQYYVGKFTLGLNGSNTLQKPLWLNKTESYTLDFSIGEDNAWRAVEGNGIQLSFLQNI